METMKMTITEALAEVRLIEKKIAGARHIVGANVSRWDHMDDPNEKVPGGSEGLVRRELQSIHDLGDRRVKIREAIAEANLNTQLKIDNVTRSIAGWLTWRREVAASEQETYLSLAAKAQRDHDQAQAKPQLYKMKDDEEAKLAKLILNLNIDELNTKARDIEEILGVLDGKLSLLNATTVIEIPQ